MSLLAPVSPQALRDALEAAGWKMVDESQHNWVYADSPGGEPLIIPKHGKLVAVPIMAEAQRRARGTPLFKLIHEAVSAQSQKQADQDDD